MQFQDIIAIINSTVTDVTEISGEWATIPSEYGDIEITPDQPGEVVISIDTYSFHLPVGAITNQYIKKYLDGYAW